MASKPRYTKIYKQIKKIALATNPVCHWCKIRPADTLDHVPPLAEFENPDLWQGQLYPACSHCNFSRGATYGNRKRKAVRQSRKW